MTSPPVYCSIEQTANAEEPPPAGSTARMKWLSRCECVTRKLSSWMSRRGRSRKASTSIEGKAFCDPSAAMPADTGG